MRKICFLLGWLIIMPLEGLRAQTMKEVFLAMPDSVLPLLDKDNRADCVDFLASKMQAKVRNAFDEFSYMDTLTTDYAFLRLTPQSTVSLKLLPVNDSTRIVCMVRTFRSDAADSQVAFYTSDWKLLPARNYCSRPVLSAFLLLDKEGADADLLKRTLTLPVCEATLSPQGTDLTWKYDINYLTEEDKKLVKGYIRPALVAQWQNGVFRFK